MSEPVVLKRPAARIDLAAHYAHIGERSLDAAERFRHQAEATFQALARSPGTGAAYSAGDPRLAGLRCSRIKRFRNHLVFYLPIEGGIEVIRVIHAARDIPTVLGSGE